MTQSARALGTLLLCALPVSASAQTGNIADVPFEQLLKTEVITADRIARQISDAASAVSIVTAEDIRTFGYRSLSDILDSMRGVSMANNSSYGYLSGRGYGNAGSLAGRLTLLIDGYRAPDNVYGQTYFGNDGLLDVALIERVEFIPGSGSSSYGDSAFLGVVNVITRKGRDVGGTELSAGFGNHHRSEGRATFGRQFENGLDLVVSTSGMRSDGRMMPPDLAPDLGRFEADRNRRYFAKAAVQGWTFETAWVDRWMPWVTDGNLTLSDVSGFSRLRYDGQLNTEVKTSIDIYYGHYRYREDPADRSWSYGAGGAWRGIDAKIVGTWFDRHTLVLGTEYRDDFQQLSEYLDDTGKYYDVLTNRQTTSFYVYDDIGLASNLQLNLGARQDARRNGATTLSPRAALICMPAAETVLKLSTGIAHRQQTLNSEFLAPNPLDEHVTTKELVWEQGFGPKTRLISSLYKYRIDNYLLGFQDGWTPGNYGAMHSKGAEFELEHLWDSGARLRASYARQYSRDPNGEPPENFARDIAKFNISVPILGEYLRAGLGARYLGSRRNFDGSQEPAYTVADLTLSGRWNNWSASASARNIGNTHYRHVSGAGFDATGTYPAEGRNFWLQLEYDFK